MEATLHRRNHQRLLSQFEALAERVGNLEAK